MLADVRPLRSKGQRLDRSNIDLAEPLRGELTVFKRHDPWRGCWVPVASLVGEDQVTYLLPPLDQVRIARWQGSDLVLVGLEEPNRAEGQSQLQSWWCRLITDPAPLRTSPLASVE